MNPALVTNFLSFNPRQHESNYKKQYLLITISNISHCLLQLRIIKSQNSTLDQTAITNSTHSQSKYTPHTPRTPLFSTVRGSSKEYLSISAATKENLELNRPPHLLDSHLKQKDEILGWPNTNHPLTIEALQPTKITKLDLLSLPWKFLTKC